MRRFLTCLIFLGLLVSAAPAQGAENDPPKVEVRLWPNPNVARRGDIVRYDLTVTNEGDGKATRTRVTIPIPKSQLSLVKIDLGEKTSWVMEYTDEKLVIMYGTLRRGERRDTQIYLKVEEAAGPAIRVRAVARHDSENGSDIRSNETLLTIQGAEVDVTSAASVEPGAGPVGTLLHFRVRNYFPEEKIFTWLNAPGGVVETKLSGQASEEGAAGLDFSTARLAPGKYSMVIYGETSKTTLVVPFELTE